MSKRGVDWASVYPTLTIDSAERVINRDGRSSRIIIRARFPADGAAGSPPCPECGGPTRRFGFASRRIIDNHVGVIVEIRLRVRRSQCPEHGTTLPEIPFAEPRKIYSTRVRDLVVGDRARGCVLREIGAKYGLEPKTVRSIVQAKSPDGT